MTKQTTRKQVCPYLGLTQDRESHFSYPESGHVCFVNQNHTPIDVEHQTAFCFGEDYTTCARYVTPTPEQLARPDDGATAEFPRVWLYSIGGMIVGLALVLMVFFAGGFGSAPQPDLPVQPVVIVPTGTFTPVAAAPPAPSDTPEAGIVAISFGTTVPITPVADGRIITISPGKTAIGWVASDEPRGNHFGDSYMYAGVYNERVYLGAMQFDLSIIPRGAPIVYGEIQLTGLRDDLLARQNDQPSRDSAWKLQLLDAEIDRSWGTISYQTLFNARVSQVLNPILGADDVGLGQVNTFELTADQLAIIEDKILSDTQPRLSFRMEGALTGADDLFAWDTGYGPQSKGGKAVLILNVGQSPATPPPYEYVVITATPTPENVMTAAAIAMQVTADAEKFGTATPLPPNVVTPTPIPNYLVIVPTETPGNLVTATAQAALATARALTTGTATPVPTNAVTATPVPSPSITPTPTVPQYVLITSTPTPASVFAAATLSARLTAEAALFGTPTPLPPNWVTPVVATATPRPANAATAQAITQLATAIAVTTGTPTPTPANQILATATPVFETISLLPTATPTLSPAEMRPIPASLKGKILFRSDREGDAEAVYVYDPQAGTLGRLTEPWPYDMARLRDALSADKSVRVFTKIPEYASDGRAQIFYGDMNNKQEYVITRFDTGISYDPVLSPTDNRIAFVSTNSGNDEIWTVFLDGSQLQRLTFNEWEGDKSPSWSPDGTKIVFQSNRTGNNQLWIMNADGSDPQLLLGWDNWTPFNDTLPVWVKFIDAP